MEPWGPERLDLAFAKMMALYAQVHAQEGKPPPTPADFMPDFLTDRTAKKSARTPEQHDQELLRIAAEIGAVVADDEEDADEGEEDQGFYAYDEDE